MRLQNVIRLVVGCSVLFNVGFSGHSLAVGRSHKVCAQVRAGKVRCFGSILSDSGGTEPYFSGTLHTYGPAVAEPALRPASYTHRQFETLPMALMAVAATIFAMAQPATMARRALAYRMAGKLMLK